MDSEHTVYIGVRHRWGGPQPFGLSRGDRRHHLYLIGKTGTGKSTLLRNLIVQDIDAGEGVGVIDPHGDLAEEDSASRERSESSQAKGSRRTVPESDEPRLLKRLLAYAQAAT